MEVVFICGLHRSGTTVLHDVISSASNVTTFKNTGVPKNEGQHLQSVYKPALAHGGPGKFAFDPGAHLTESSELITPENRKKLIEEWSAYWDSTKAIFVEKSPPNLLRMRFLQALFPACKFITIWRHPVAVALATQKWSKTSIKSLFDHWLTAYDIYLEDQKYIKSELQFRYEEFTAAPDLIIEAINKYLSTEIQLGMRVQNMNQKYFNRFNRKRWWDILWKQNRSQLMDLYEAKFNEHGYSLIDLSKHDKLISNRPGA